MSTAPRRVIVIRDSPMVHRVGPAVRVESVRRQSQNRRLNDRLLVQLVLPGQRERVCPAIFSGYRTDRITSQRQ